PQASRSGPQAGTASSGKAGDGHRATRHDSGPPSQRASGPHGALGQTSGIIWRRQRASGHQASGHLARQRAPRHLGQGSGHRVTRHDSGF
ncbi:unnamed protein product, partial [Staurois parvus]